MKIWYYSILAAIIALGSCSGEYEQASAYGNFEVDEVLVSSEASGKCMQMYMLQGMVVQKGDTIASLDTTILYLQKQQLIAQKAAVKSNFPAVTAQVRVQEEELSRLQKDETRLKALLKDKAATQKQLDDVQSGIAKIRRSIEQIKTRNESLFAELEVLDAGIAVLDEQIKKCFVFSPVSGTILEHYVEAGELLAPGRGIVRIADLSAMNLKAWVSGDQLSEIKLGQHYTVRIDKPDDEYYEYKGELIWVSPEAEFTPTHIQTKEERVEMVYAVKVRVINDGRIKIGMPGEIVW